MTREDGTDGWPQLTHVLAESDRARLIYSSIIAARRYGYEVHRGWESPDAVIGERHTLPDLNVLLEVRTSSERDIVAELSGSLLLLSLFEHPRGGCDVRLSVAAPTQQVAETAQGLLRAALPEREAEDPATVPIGFWRFSPDRPSFLVKRDLVCPAWHEIQMNYPASTLSALESIFGDWRGLTAAGRLVLWHGPPGTGKTFALRALVRERRRDTRFEYIVDPEVVFGSDTRHLFDLLEPEMESWPDRSARRVLVLEDSDDFLTLDARQRAGNGLSRLLNTVDGLLGQGLDLMVLITTNEPVGRFHPAVSRPGRCAAAVTFDPFGPGEATEWLRRTGSDLPVAAEGVTLAELYAAVVGRPPFEARSTPVGFVR